MSLKDFPRHKKWSWLQVYCNYKDRWIDFATMKWSGASSTLHSYKCCRIFAANQSIELYRPRKIRVHHKNDGRRRLEADNSAMKLGFPQLKEKQIDVIVNFLKGQDVLAGRACAILCLPSCIWYDEPGYSEFCRQWRIYHCCFDSLNSDYRSTAQTKYTFNNRRHFSNLWCTLMEAQITCVLHLNKH